MTGRPHVSWVVKGSPAGEGVLLGLLDGVVVMVGDAEVLLGEGELAVVPLATHPVRAQNAIRAAAAILTRFRTKSELDCYASGTGTGLSGTARAAKHPRTVGAGDDARVRHREEQPVLNHTGGDLDRRRQSGRIVDAVFELQV